MSKIIIHQAYYGEVNRAHSQICQTIDDPELTSFLIQFTDRPGSLTPGVVLEPYLSGSAFKNYYVFSKTFPDSQASRSGMVITHVLIVDIPTLQNINDLKSILSLLISKVPVTRTNLKPLELSIKNSEHFNESKQPIFIQKSLSSFIQGDLPLLFTGSLNSFEDVLQKLWNSPIDGFREQIKYRASFSPKDIIDLNDLTIVLIQSELLRNWNAHKLIRGDEEDNVEITSPVEALFLGRKEGNPLYEFLQELGSELHDFNTYKKGSDLFEDYNALDDLNDPDQLRRNLRILATLSPNKSLGTSVKERFIKKYLVLIYNGLEYNVKGLRNILWDSFNKGNETGKNFTNAIINKAIRDFQFKHIEMLSEISFMAVTKQNKTWWDNAVIDSLEEIITKEEEVIQKSVWKLLLHSKNTSKSIFSIIPHHKDLESLLIQYLPRNIPREIGRSVLVEIQKRKWYLLHAEILLKLHTPLEAVRIQLPIEDALSYDQSIGLKMILKKLSDEDILSITLESCNKKLINCLIARLVKNEHLFYLINLRDSCWLDIWTALLNIGRSFNYGIRGREQDVVYNIFDLALEGAQISSIVFKKIANTPYSNISEYRNRQKAWEYIPAIYQAKFVEATSNSVVEKIAREETIVLPIEAKLADHITSSSFMTSFLSRNDLGRVLRVFESFTSLSDRFLRDYINRYSSQITKEQSQRLGSLILSRSYTASAQVVYKKYKYYKSFTTAFETCKSLVELNWWEELSLFTPFNKTKEKNYQMEQSDKIPENPIGSLPTIVILTAIQEEYNAVRQFLKEIVDIDMDDTIYEVGILELFGNDIAKIVIRECGAKNTIAAQETERAISHFKPDAIFFVGIAGSRKPNDFSIGDVIFPTKIYSYEAGKAGKEKFRPRPDLASTTYTLSEIAKRERRKDEWKQLIKNDQNTEVKADLGIIASGEQLIEHYDSEVGGIITDHYNDTSAIEMEGFGFANAAKRQGKIHSNMMIGIVRGISDIIEQPGRKDSESSTDRRPDNAKQLASDTAAAFAFWLIFKAFPL